MARTQRPADDTNPNPKRPRRGAANGNGDGTNDALNSDDAIARRAYEIYLNRGGTHGADLDDWLEAERQLRRGPTDVTGPQPKPRRRAKENPVS